MTAVAAKKYYVTINMNKNKQFIIIGAVASALVVGGIMYAVKFLSNADTSSSPAQPAVNVVDYGPPKDTDKIQPSSKDQAASPTDETPGEVSKLNVQLTQTRQEGQTVYIRTLIEGTNGGDCTLTLSKGDYRIEKTAPVGVQASYAVCQGFNIPVTEFKESGDWDVIINVKGPGSKEGTASGKLTITL